MMCTIIWVYALIIVTAQLLNADDYTERIALDEHSTAASNIVKRDVDIHGMSHP